MGLIFILLIGAAYANKALSKSTAKVSVIQNKQQNVTKENENTQNSNTNNQKSADPVVETKTEVTSVPAPVNPISSTASVSATTTPVTTKPVVKVASTSTPSPKPTPAPTSVSTTNSVYSIASAQDYIESQLLTLVNAERTRVGVAPLAYNSLLAQAADIRVGEESITSFVGVDHVRPNGSSFSTVFAQVGYTGYTAVGENLVWGYQSQSTFTQSFLNSLANQMFISWKNSPGHYANMINSNYTQTGFGVTLINQNGKLYYFGIEEFGKR